METLNNVSDAMLLEALHKAEPQIAMLALAGAPPHLLDRILSQLPRRQAKRFRRQLHSLQPTRMSDLLAAQQRFTQLAIEEVRSEERGVNN
jgi:flagellar motor switch protein FliG